MIYSIVYHFDSKLMLEDFFFTERILHACSCFIDFFMVTWLSLNHAD